ncbi:MAG: iron ABC transporter substrate-binding protein [bacterium]
MKRTNIFGLYIIVNVLVVASAGVAASTVTVTDMAKRQVTVPFDPERIICLSPGALRLIVYLQAESKVVGVEDMEKMNPGYRPYWIAHPELWELPSCGPGGPVGINKKPDLEAVLSVKPEVIFITYMDASLADEVQRTLKIPVVVLSYGDFGTFDDTVYDAMRIVGKVLNREKRAEEVVAYIESLRMDMRMRTKDISEESKPIVYVGGIGYRGTQGIESSEQQYIPFEWIGANNVAKKVKATSDGHVVIDKETLLKLNPDVIFIDGGGIAHVKEDYRKKPEIFAVLKAFANRRVHTLYPFNWYMTNIDTTLADAYAIGKILYEKQFDDIDPQQKADEIYTFLVGKPVYENMRKDYGHIGQVADFLN